MTQQNIQYLRVGSLIDGRGGPVRKNQRIIIDRGSITKICDDTSPETIPAEQLTDLSHCVVLPVLIDSHVHLCMSGTIDQEFREKQLDASYQELIPIIEEHLRHHFSHGVLAVRDGGDQGSHVLRYLKELHDPTNLPVRTVSPGTAYHQRDRYGSLIGVCTAGDETLLQAFLRRAQPTKLVKVVNSGVNSLTSFGKQTDPQFDTEQLKEIVNEAKRQGCKVMVHANGKAPVRGAIEAGCNSIEHGFFMGRENLELMAEKGVFWVPTVYTMKACAEHITFCVAEAQKEVVEKNLVHQLEQLSYARSCGVNVALGTDAGSIGVLHGEALAGELKLFVQAGFSLTEAIRCATENGARLLGLEHEYGVIKAGKPAHFIVSRGTPAQLPRKLCYLEAIYINGAPSVSYRKFYRAIPDHRV